MKFPYYKQQDQMDGAPTCLRMVSKHFGRNVAIQKLRNLCFVNRGGVNLLALAEAAEKIGFRTTGAKLGISQLKQAELPCILHWRQNHFVILHKIAKKRNPLLRRGQDEALYHLADPGSGLMTLTEAEFAKSWFSHPEVESGIALLLSPTPQFYSAAAKFVTQLT